MKRRRLLGVVLIVVALVTAIVGGIIFYGSLYRSVDYAYWVDITAPDDLDWSLWIPHPKASMNPETHGNVFSVASVETAHGIMGNVTGRGPASIAWSLHREVYAPESGGNYVAEPLEMSGINDSLSWVWRSSADPVASLRVYGVTWWKATSYSEKIECGSSHYGGLTQEGWSSLSVTPGDCVVGVGSPGGFATTGILFVIVSVLVAASPFIWRKKRAGLPSPDSRDNDTSTKQTPGK